MAITPGEILHTAKLANLALTADETDQFGRDLVGILAYIDQLKEVDITDVPPATCLSPGPCVLREDSIAESLACDKIRANAPDWHQGMFRVPRVIG